MSFTNLHRPPPLEIFVHNKRAGYIERGHRKIVFEELRGLGIFSEAMRQLERQERLKFKKGQYPNYFRAIENEVGELCLKGTMDFIKRLPGENHFDYTRLAPVAGKLMELKYNLTIPDKHFVLNLMKKRSAKRETIIKYLKSISNEQIFSHNFVLYKPAK